MSATWQRAQAQRTCTLAAQTAAVLAAALTLVACQTADMFGTDMPLSLDAPKGAQIEAQADFADMLPTETYRLGLEHFKRGEYGLAERYFRATTEKNPANVGAWIGLAGSYDNIRRFELADRAYGAATRLSGETVQILNNESQSYMLRGDYRTARVKLRRALRLEPGNVTVINNLRILDANEPRRIAR